jgi:radical SAM-linked protein
MIGLPTETGEDVEGIVKLCREIARLDRRKNLNVSISTFVPKPQTPFQWESCEPRDTIIKKQQYIKDSLRSRTVQVKYHDHKLSLLEAVFSRGDRRLAGVLVQAQKLGAGYDAWSEHFKYEVWEQAFDNAGIDKAFYLQEKSTNGILPWDHISFGLSRQFLLGEREKSRTGVTTADCRREACTGCGVCQATGAQQQVTLPGSAEVPASTARLPEADTVFRYRLIYTKQGPARFVSHLEFSSSFCRSLRRAGLPLRYSQGFHPLPRVTFHEALSVGIECREARCDLELTERVPSEEILCRLAPQLPPGIDILTVAENIAKTGSAPDTLKAYRIIFPQHVHGMPDKSAASRCIEEFGNRGSFIIMVEKKGVQSEADLKLLITELRLEDGGPVMLKMNTAGRSAPRITDIAGALFGLDQRARKLLRIESIPT